MDDLHIEWEHAYIIHHIFVLTCSASYLHILTFLQRTNEHIYVHILI